MRPTFSLVSHDLCESPQTVAQQLRAAAEHVARQPVDVELQLPKEAILLPARDDLAEYEPTAPQNLKDDPRCVPPSNWVTQLAWISHSFT